MATTIKPKEKKILQQAQALLSQNNAGEAKKLLVNYKKSNKASDFTNYYLALSHAIMGEPNKALPLVNKLAKKQPDNIDYLKLLGCVYHDSGQYSKAISVFRRVLKIDSNDFQTLTNIANSLKETHQFEEAESFYIKSLKIQPSQPDALTNYGLLMQANARIDEAIELHKKALQCQPQHQTASYNLAYALNEKGENETSLQLYMQIITMMPNHVRALCDIAHLYGKMNQPEKAVPYLQRALALAPDDEHVNLNFGITHKMTGNYKDAEECFNRVTQINPDNRTARYYLAIMKGDNTIDSSPDEYIQELFDGYAETFDDQLVNKLQYRTPELIADILKKYTDSDRKYKILDLGCGTGLAGIYLKEFSEYMVGIDLSEKMIKKAEQRGLYDELDAIGINQYFESSDFKPDIITSADVFVYIGDISRIFEHAGRAINQGGFFVFSTEDTKETREFLLKDSGRFAHNEEYIRKLADNNSFDLIENHKTVLRYDANKPIHGQVYLLRKQA